MGYDMIRAGSDRPRRPLNKAQRERRAAIEDIRDEVQLAAVMAGGVTALSGHIMECLTDLDQHRRELAGGDPVLNMALGEIEAQAIRKSKAIQRGLYSEWE